MRCSHNVQAQLQDLDPFATVKSDTISHLSDDFAPRSQLISVSEDYIQSTKGMQNKRIFKKLPFQPIALVNNNTVRLLMLSLSVAKSFC